MAQRAYLSDVNDDEWVCRRVLDLDERSGSRAGYDGANRQKGSKVQGMVDTLEHLLPMRVTAANEQDRAQVQAMAEQGIQLQVIKLPGLKKGFVLLPHRWVVERSLAWVIGFRRLARDYERLPETLAGLRFLAFAVLMLARFISLPSPKHALNSSGAQELFWHCAP